ncbi:MAG: hypothetical protein OEY78_06880 [Gammaproteobacteria bacterium]|nr:hypothetical protein [Gammaproteobacteria bacterium]
MAHTVSWEADYLYRKFTGEITGEEILKSNFDIQTHPYFTKIKYLVNDFSETQSILIDPEYARIFALTDDIISATKGRLKIAIVTNNDTIIELTKDYYAAMENKLFKCETFSTLEEAMNWGQQEL